MDRWFAGLKDFIYRSAKWIHGGHHWLAFNEIFAPLLLFFFRFWILLFSHTKLFLLFFLCRLSGAFKARPIWEVSAYSRILGFTLSYRFEKRIEGIFYCVYDERQFKLLSLFIILKFNQFKIYELQIWFSYLNFDKNILLFGFSICTKTLFLNGNLKEELFIG